MLRRGKNNLFLVNPMSFNVIKPREIARPTVCLANRVSQLLQNRCKNGSNVRSFNYDIPLKFLKFVLTQWPRVHAGAVSTHLN